MLNSNGKRLQPFLYSIFHEPDSVVDALTAPDTDHREIKMPVRAMRNHITDYIIACNRKHPHTAYKTVLDFGETNLEDYDIIINEKTDAIPICNTTNRGCRFARDSPCYHVFQSMNVVNPNDSAKNSISSVLSYCEIWN